MPTWRIPPPSRLRHTLASAMRSALDASIEPMGAPRPFEKQTETVSKSSPYADSGVPVATCAFHSRAPSRCISTPASPVT